MKHLIIFLFAIVLSIGANAQSDSTKVAADATEQASIDTKTVIAEFLKQLLEFTKDAGAFAKEQIPLVLKEYIYWGIASSVVWLLPFLVMLYFSFRIWRWAIDKIEESDWFSLVSAIAYTAIMLPGILYHLLDLMKAIVAPRVYLIEQLTSMLKSCQSC